MPERTKTHAYVLPFFVFAAFLALTQLAHSLGQSFWWKHCEFWIYPVQTLVCGGLVVFFWRAYSFAPPRRVMIAASIGILICILWITPQAFLHQPARNDGFNPELLRTAPAIYWATILFRFLRLVVVVPLIEEVFWRGFLLRYVIDQDFEGVPIGAFSWPSFAVVAVLFMLSHATADWPAAVLSGALFNSVAYVTRSLASCVVAHSVANLCLGLWIMQTSQWGFW